MTHVNIQSMLVSKTFISLDVRDAINCSHLGELIKQFYKFYHGKSYG